MKNKKRGEGGMGVKKDGGLLLKLSFTEKEGLFERGGLNRGFKMLLLLGCFCLSDVKKSINPALIASKRCRVFPLFLI